MRKRDEVSDPKSCLNRALPAELVFVLLGRDPAAPAAIRAWMMARVAMELNTLADAQLVEADRCQEVMDREREMIRRQVELDDEDKDHTLLLWSYAVGNKKTRLGYKDWVAFRRAAPVELKCPVCGNTDLAQMRYLEDIQSYRNVVEIVNSEVIIESAYETGEGYDDGNHPRIECRAELADGTTCLQEFNIPEALEVEWE